MEKSNIYQRLNEVRKKVSYLQKNKEVQGYKAVTHDEVTGYLREHFIANGIVTVPYQVDSSFDNVGETKNGNIIIRYSGWYEVHFVNIDDPSDILSLKIESHAMDHGDKAPGKALSYAVKYAMLKVLNIETGEDEESRIEVQKRMEESKPKLTPDHPKWNDAVTNLASAKVTMDVIKKHYQVDEAKLNAEVKKVNGTKN